MVDVCREAKQMKPSGRSVVFERVSGTIDA